MARILAIDYGLKRLGLALSDPRQILATALETLSAGKKCQETVTLIVNKLNALKAEQREVEKIVVGLPLHLSGKIGVIGDEVLHFVKLLHEQTGLPVITWDERLTSLQAERLLRDAQLNRKKRAQVIDSMSAVIILQNYLDSLGHTIPKSTEE